jgi:hypothetical protein
MMPGEIPAHEESKTRPHESDALNHIRVTRVKDTDTFESIIKSIEGYLKT